MVKEEKIKTIAEKWTDEMGTLEPQQYFYEGQIDYLESLDEEHLNKIFEENKNLLGINMTREEKIFKVAEYWLDSADLDALMNAYYDNSVDYLESLTDDEFELELKDYCISFDENSKLVQG